jgi:diadenosine tetraphosphate (Ap4A) HIT family hydrolase
MVPHLHWHVVARFDTDAHFPAPIWAQPARADDAAQLLQLTQLLPTLDAALQSALTTNRN